MDNSLIPMGWFEGLVAVIAAGLTGWIFRLESKGAENACSNNNLRDRVVTLELDLARNYHSKGDIKEIVQDAMKPLHSELERLSRAVERLSGDARARTD